MKGASIAFSLSVHSASKRGLDLSCLAKVALMVTAVDSEGLNGNPLGTC